MLWKLQAQCSTEDQQRTPGFPFSLQAQASACFACQCGKQQADKLGGARVVSDVTDLGPKGRSSPSKSHGDRGESGSTENKQTRQNLYMNKRTAASVTVAAGAVKMLNASGRKILSHVGFKQRLSGVQNPVFVFSCGHKPASENKFH